MKERRKHLLATLNSSHFIDESSTEYNSIYQFMFYRFCLHVRRTLELLNWQYGFQDSLPNYNYRSADSCIFSKYIRNSINIHFFTKYCMLFYPHNQKQIFINDYIIRKSCNLKYIICGPI
jgi:hypothetical protein